MGTGRGVFIPVVFGKPVAVHPPARGRNRKTVLIDGNIAFFIKSVVSSVVEFSARVDPFFIFSRRDDIDQSAHGIRTVENALGPPENLNTLDIGSRDILKGRER